MREAGAARSLVLGTDVVPDVDGDDRRLAVGMHHHAQAVRQGELLVGDVDGQRGRRIGRGDRGVGDRAGKGQAEGERERGAGS